MLGEQLVGAGLLHPDKLAEAKLHQELTGKELVEALLTLGLVPERDLLRVLAQHHQLQYLTTEKIAQLKVPDEVLDLVKVRIAESLPVMPIRRNPDGTLWVLGASPLADQGEGKLKAESGAKKVNVILARPASIRAAIRRHYYRDPDAFAAVQDRSLGQPPPLPTEPSLPAIRSSDRDSDRDSGGDSEERTQMPFADPRENTDPHISLTALDALATTVFNPVITSPIKPSPGMAKAAPGATGAGRANLGATVVDRTDPDTREDETSVTSVSVTGATRPYRTVPPAPLGPPVPSMPFAPSVPPVPPIPPVTPSEISRAVGEVTHAEGSGPRVEGEITRKVKRAISDAQQNLERENQRLRVALSLASAMGQIHRQEDVIRELLVALLDLFPAEGAAFALIGEPGRPVVLETLRRDTGPAFQVSGALIAAAATLRTPLVSGNVPADPRLLGEKTLIQRGVRSVLISVVRSRDGHPTGALYVEAKDLSVFGADSVEMLRVLAQVAGIAIDQVGLILRLEVQARMRAIHERFLAGQRALAAALGSPVFDLRPQKVEGTFLLVRPMPQVRPRGSEPVAQLFGRIEAHVDSVCARIHANGGLVESISRGEVGALFGGPESHGRHADNALAAALEIFSLTSTDGRTLPVAVGAASGQMLGGGAGRGGQLQYAVMGEPVELARALAATAASLDLHASEAVEQAATGHHQWEPLEAGITLAGELRPALKLVWR